MLLLGYTALILCWMYCTAEKECQDSPPRRVKEVPTEVWDKPPYPHGTQATYTCRPGYMKIGRIVFECDNGAWKQRLPAVECRNRPCGHPGDTQFGTFELTKGTEFVFGARVEYRCNEGYWMLSQRNYRECQADGWSNDVPHCEVAKCSPVEAPINGRIVASGAFELGHEYTFGQVVSFECDANYKLVGSKEIVCSSDGQWDADVPQCQDISCDLPQIPHGSVLSPKSSYKESEKLQFACNEGYTYGERANAQCTESGWNPTPYCIELVCYPPRIAHGNFAPQELKYRLGDTITVRCHNGYYFKAPTGRSTSECTKKGWNPNPQCVHKPCDYPAIEYGRLSATMEYYKDSHFPMEVGRRVEYYCFNGYSTPNGRNWFEIVCSGRGWTPEPKCLKTCHVVQLNNGYYLNNRKSVYKEGELVKYACYNDHNAEREATCTREGWAPELRCLPRKTCQYVRFDNGYLSTRMYRFDLQTSVPYNCDTGFVTPEGKATGMTVCQDNGWTPPPKCIRSCQKPPLYNLNYHTNKTVFMPEDTIEFVCSEGYQTINNVPAAITRCGTDGEWSPTPQCRAIECEMLTLANGDFTPKEDKYRNGDVVRFTCAKNYVRVGPASAQCYHFGWFPSPPTCKASAVGCGPPPEIANGSIAGDPAEQYRHGDRVQYECDAELKMVGSKEIECVDGEWSSRPSCIEDKRPCGSPASIPNIVLHPQNQTHFSHGDEVAYGCKQRSRSSKAMKTKCLNGEWKPLPLCADPFPTCEIPMNIELNETLPSSKQRKEKRYPRNIVYRCSSDDRSIKVASCVSGKWSPAIECADEETTCPPPPQAPGTQHITVASNYRNGSKIAFSCLEGFQLVGRNEITCIEGKWQSPPYCVEKPCLPPQPLECAEISELQNQNLETSKEGKTVYLTGATFNYVSRSGYELVGQSEITCSMGTWTPAPTCLEMPCGRVPEVANAQIEGRNKERYEPGETILYQCDSGFVAVGLPEIICREGNWTAPPSCKDLYCGAAPRISNGRIISAERERYPPGSRVQYECRSTYHFKSVSYITCTDGEWSQAPVCRGEGGKCGVPPVIANGDLLSFALDEYPPGTTLEYKCPSFYVLKGSRYITCDDGEWTSPPECLVACTASQEDMLMNNIELKWSHRPKLYSTSGDYIEFRCRRGYFEDSDASTFRAECVEGTLKYPRCKPGRNCTVYEAVMEANKIQLQTSVYHYQTGDYIHFECRWWHTEAPHNDFTPKCLDGKIVYPRCERRTLG